MAGWRRDAPKIPGFRFRGFGPRATGWRGTGWVMRPTLYGRCARCGDLLSLKATYDPADPTAESWYCGCGALHKDLAAGRFGHDDGDASIAIYEQIAQRRPRRTFRQLLARLRAGRKSDDLGLGVHRER